MKPIIEWPEYTTTSTYTRYMKPTKKELLKSLLKKASKEFIGLLIWLPVLPLLGLIIRIIVWAFNLGYNLF
jgi:hypothetical protein